MNAPADRIRLLRALKPARAPVIAALVVVLLAERLVPAASAAAVGLLVGRLGSVAGEGEVFAAALAPLAVFAGVLVVGHVGEALLEPLKFLAGVRIDGPHRERVARIAASSARIEALERPEVQTLVRDAMADRSRGYDCTPSDGAVGQLRWGAGLLGAAAACAVLAVHHWWLVPLVLLPAALYRVLRTRDEFVLSGMWRGAVKGELHADVWREASTSPGEGKDIRIYGFADWMIHRMQSHIRTANAELWGHIEHMIRGSWRQFLIVLVGLVPAYVLVAHDAAGGAADASAAAAVFAAGWSLFQVLGPDSEMYHVHGALRVLRAYDKLCALVSEEETAAASTTASTTASTSEATPGATSADPTVPAQPLADGGRRRPPLVRFDNLTFRYRTGDRDVLRGLDLEIRPGELLAIVGLNGAGKSTLIKLLAGLYTPTSGRITVDGQDLATLPLAEWRKRLSVVFQDFVKYQLSAADNVAFGRGDTPRDRAALDAAARDAGLESVLARLPAGWDTPLARSRKDGVDLSGGQWQQVVLARALYAVRRDARLLVLDEPTAHLDVRSEFEVFDRLAKHRGDTSVVLISHRLSTVRQADRIVLLEGGRITESGTHEELMALRGRYAEMFDIQAERFRRGFDDRIDTDYDLDLGPVLTAQAEPDTEPEPAPHTEPDAVTEEKLP